MRTNRVVLEFGDGEFPFALNASEVEELQKKCGAPDEKGIVKPVGFGLIFQRAQLGAWSNADVYHTIRLGLEGGGMSPVEARRTAERYAVPPYRAGIPGGPEATMLAILGAAMHGLEDLPPGEAETPKDLSTSGKSEQAS